MTGQIADRYYYNGEEYSFVAYQPKLNFTPQVFNLTPSSISTSCWRGFWCSFDISDSGLYLNELYIHTDNDKYPDILNVKVADIEYVECMAITSRNRQGCRSILYGTVWWLYKSIELYACLFLLYKTR